MAEIDTGAWDGAAAMSGCASADDPAAAYAAICAGRREGDPAVQATWALPHHSAPGDPPNADGVRNSLSRLPQTQGLTNGEAAQRHLDAHMADIQAAAQQRSDAEPRTLDIATEIEVRDAAKREIGMRIVPWNTVVETRQGLEAFAPGAFDHVDPTHVVLRMDHQNPPAGRGISSENRPDGQHMAFRVSATPRGDEILTLAADGVANGASVGFSELPGGTHVQSVSGRRVRIHSKVDLAEVSTTWQPAYPEAAIQYVRSVQGDGQMAEPQEAPVGAIDFAPLLTAMREDREAQQGTWDTVVKQFAERMEKLEERSRSNFVIPAASQSTELPVASKRGDWMNAVLNMLSGGRVNDLQMRDLADLVTSDNVGVVPDAFLPDIIGVIDPTRPFLQSTSKLALPNAGMSIVVPKIVTRPTAGVQAKYGDESYPEKSDVTSTATSITNETFDAVTIAGGGDISLQLLRRSSPAYLDLFLRLLAEAYGQNCESEALTELLAGVGGAGGVNDGGTVDPEDLLLSAAWVSAAAVKKSLTNIWLSSAAVGAFIDAKANTTNAPLYSNIQAGFTAGGGAQGTISGLSPIYVPALDSTAYDVLVGPRSGFAWTEDGTYTLQVDVPAKAGRDVALVGILWFAPMYPTAFTAYSLSI